MRRTALALPVAAAAVVAAGVSSAAPSSHVDWDALKYFHADAQGAELYVSTGPAWHAHVVRSQQQVPFGAPDWARHRVPQPLWLRECGRTAQKATFSVPSLNAVRSVTVEVNGREVGRSDSQFENSGFTRLTLGPHALKALRYGANEIAIHATKPALRRASRRAIGRAPTTERTTTRRASPSASTRRSPRTCGRIRPFRPRGTRSCR